MSFPFRVLFFLLFLSNAASVAASAALPLPTTLYSAPSTVLLLAHRWEAKSIYLDLDVNGTFEGRLADGAALYGLWEMKSDRKTLLLTNDPMDEEEFEKRYQVVDVSFDQLRLKDTTSGKTTTLYLAE